MIETGFNAELGQTQFLDLLVTQLQNQDPLDPVGQEQFLQQLSQFSMLDGIERLNAQFSDLLQLQTLTNGAQIVGRVVEYQGESGLARGTVESVSIELGQLLLSVNGEQVPITNVKTVTNQPSTAF